jgi:hypothetical protein
LKGVHWGEMISVEFVNDNGVIIDVNGTDGLGVGIAVTVNLKTLFFLSEVNFWFFLLFDND